MATWYPNADGKCAGSFMTVVKSGSNHIHHGNKLLLQCPKCLRFVGMRCNNSRKAVLQQHMPVPAKSTKCQRPSCGKAYSRHDQGRCPNHACGVGLNFTDIGHVPLRQKILLIDNGPMATIAALLEKTTGVSIDRVIDVAAFGTPADERALFAEVSENMRDEQRRKLL